MTSDEAWKSLLAVNGWLVVRVPVLLWFTWAIFLPLGWRVILSIFAVLQCTFMSGCVVGEVSDAHLSFMVISQGLGLVGFFSAVMFAFGYLQRRDWRSRAIGVAGIVVAPLLLIAWALVVLVVGEWFNVPFEVFWAFFDRWTPIDGWKVAAR
jgi:hypothetical protein